MSGAPARGGVLRQRDFRLLWIGETTSALGANVTRLAVPLVAVLMLEASTFEVALLAAAGWLPWLVIGLPAGAWVDRLPRRPLMLVCDLVALALLLSVPVAAWADGLTFPHLLVVELLVGAAGVFFQTAYQVYLPGILEADRLPEANALLQGSEAATQVAGPGVAGLVTQAVGAVAGLLVDAVSFAVSAVSLWRIRTPEQRRAGAVGTGGLWRQVGEGLRFLAADPYLRVLAGYGALSNLALTGYQSILVVFLVREVGVGAATVGLIVAGMSVGGLLGAAVSGRVARRFGTARGMIAANAAAGPFALLIPLGAPGPALALVVVGGLGVGAGIVVGNVLKGSFRQTYTPRRLLGRVVVGMQFLNYGTIPLGALTGGALGATVGLRPTMWIMVAGVALAPLVLLVGPAKRARDFPASPAQTDSPVTRAQAGQAPDDASASTACAAPAGSPS